MGPRSRGTGQRLALVAQVHRVEDPVEVLHRGELHREATLALPEGDAHPGLEAVGEVGGEVVELRAAAAGPRGAAGGRGGVVTEGDELLDRAHREALGHDPLRHPLHGGGIGQAEQGAGVPGAEHAGGDAALHGRVAA